MRATLIYGAGGLVNTAHQLGSALGLGILVTVAAAAGTDLADHVTAALTGSTMLLVLALIISAAVVVPGERRRLLQDHARDVIRTEQADALSV